MTVSGAPGSRGTRKDSISVKRSVWNQLALSRTSTCRSRRRLTISTSRRTGRGRRPLKRFPLLGSCNPPSMHMPVIRTEHCGRPPSAPQQPSTQGQCLPLRLLREASVTRLCPSSRSSFRFGDNPYLGLPATLTLGAVAGGVGLASELAFKQQIEVFVFMELAEVRLSQNTGAGPGSPGPPVEPNRH